MNKTAFISFNTGGTLGHIALISKLAARLADVNEIYVLLEEGNNAVMPISDSRITIVPIKRQNHLCSNAGEVHYSAKDEIIRFCNERGINSVIYSTFFDKELVDSLKQDGIQNIYTSYPLRDSYANLFFLRRNNLIFDKVVILSDLVCDNYPESVTKSNPILVPFNDGQGYENQILLTCGGGGRPSSVKFLTIVEKYITEIRKLFPNLEVTLISGPNNKDISIDEITVLKSTDNLQKFIDNSRVVISEAGYFTTHELISRSKPSILIPGERRIDNQELRAIEYDKQGFGYCFMPEEDIGLLVDKTLNLLTNDDSYRAFQNRSKEYYFSFDRDKDIEKIIGELIT